MRSYIISLIKNILQLYTWCIETIKYAIHFIVELNIFQFISSTIFLLYIILVILAYYNHETKNPFIYGKYLILKLIEHLKNKRKEIIDNVKKIKDKVNVFLKDPWGVIKNVINNNIKVFIEYILLFILATFLGSVIFIVVCIIEWERLHVVIPLMAFTGVLGVLTGDIFED